MNIHGVRVITDLHVLALVCLDVVLGNMWLRSIGPIIHNYVDMTMKFKIGGKKKTQTTLSTK